MFSGHASLLKKSSLNARSSAKASARRLLTDECVLEIEIAAWSVAHSNVPWSFLWSANDHGSLAVLSQAFRGWQEDLEGFCDFYFSISLDLTYGNWLVLFE